MGQNHMLSTINWTTSNTSTMDSWMGATSSVDYMIAQGLEGFSDLQGPLDTYGSSAIASAPSLSPTEIADSSSKSLL